MTVSAPPKAFLEIGLSMRFAVTASMEVSTLWPAPSALACLWYRAASTPLSACIPLVKSTTETPTLTGGAPSSAGPVTLMSPPAACRRLSNAGLSA